MTEPPFSGTQVQDSFPEYAVEVPHLGCGAFKVAYKAASPDGDLVVKILTEPLEAGVDVESTDLPARFARELRGMTIVNSPFLVAILRHPEVRQIGADNYLWYAEPYYPGGTLEERLAQGETGPKLATSVLLAMLEAVHAMWSTARIVHRDIKPGNIVFDDAGIPVLLDLGIAFFPDLSTLTDAMGSSPRTPRYAAPEQFEMRRAATIDFRTDLYLVGMVAFEALTGKHPFWDPSVDHAAYFDRLNGFDGSSLEFIDCPSELKGLITRLLAPRPSGRFRNVDIPLMIARGLV